MFTTFFMPNIVMNHFGLEILFKNVKENHIFHHYIDSTTLSVFLRKVYTSIHNGLKL